jgi:GR25 family glycosyltransferase involved in LPS biosynthesis
MEKVACKMIVYTKSQKRMDNFNKIKEIIPTVELFEAVDAINEFDKYKQIALENNYATQEFIKNCMNLYRGKPRYGVLGCALSHIFVLQDFNKKSNKDWLLIFEDDLELNNFHPKIIEYLITNAEKNNSNYVHLFINSHFYKQQMAQEKVAPDLYKMIKQWGTVAYLVNKKGAQTLLDRMPYKHAVDNEFSGCIKDLNALCFLNDIFKTKGALRPGHVNSEMGSLLWNIIK